MTIKEQYRDSVKADERPKSNLVQNPFYSPTSEDAKWLRFLKFAEHHSVFNKNPDKEWDKEFEFSIPIQALRPGSNSSWSLTVVYNKNGWLAHAGQKTKEHTDALGFYAHGKTLKDSLTRLVGELVTDNSEKEEPSAKMVRDYTPEEIGEILNTILKSGGSQNPSSNVKESLSENINLDIDIGDIVLGGKFKNKRTIVKSIGKDELGQPTINGKPILKFRIEKLLPKEKQSKKTRDSMEEQIYSVARFQKLAGILKEERNMYGEIIDPDYYVEIWPRRSLVYDVGPFDSELDAERDILERIGSKEFYIDDEPKLEKVGDRSWFNAEENTEYSIVEREKQS